MNRKPLIITLVAVALVIAIILTVLIVSSVRGGAPNNKYSLLLGDGEKYLNEGKYDEAIAKYLSAIELDPNSDDAYYQLALIYMKVGRSSDAKGILEQGIQKTNSFRLQELYTRFFGNTSGEIESKDGSSAIDVSLNETALRKIANYSFEDYSSRGILSNDNYYNKEYTAHASNPGMVLYFYNDGSDKSIDESSREPLEGVRPNYVVLDNVYEIFNGADSDTKLYIEDLRVMDGITDVKTGDEKSVGRCVYFTAYHCNFVIELNGDDTLNLKDGYNRVSSDFGTGADELNVVRKVKVTFTVKDATTARGIDGAAVIVYDERNNNVWNGTTNSSGKAEVEVEPGIYKITVEKDGYDTETFEVEIYNTGETDTPNLVISPTLAAGTMRIVVEWSDYPRDIDSWLLDEETRSFVSYRNKRLTVDGNLIAELDVDDTDGYGPETTTIYDLSRDYSFRVIDFNATGQMFNGDVTVKVYLAGESTPRTFTLTGNYEETYGFEIFRWEDGRIVEVMSPSRTTTTNPK